MSERAQSELASTVALGLLCSLGAGLPAAARVIAGGLPATSAVALWASVSLVVVPVACWLRTTRRGGVRPADRALVAGAALSSLPLALFGGVLKSTTHHRPLGGATFAVAALGVLALCIGLSLRIMRRSGSGAVKSAWQNLFILGCGLSLAGTLLLAAAGAARPSLLDFLALLTASGVAGVVKIPGWLRWAQPASTLPLWAALIASGVLAAGSAHLPRSLTTQAPVSFAPLSWLGVGS